MVETRVEQLTLAPSDRMIDIMTTIQHLGLQLAHQLPVVWIKL